MPLSDPRRAIYDFAVESPPGEVTITAEAIWTASDGRLQSEAKSDSETWYLNGIPFSDPNSFSLAVDWFLSAGLSQEKAEEHATALLLDDGQTYIEPTLTFDKSYQIEGDLLILTDDDIAILRCWMIGLVSALALLNVILRFVGQG